MRYLVRAVRTWQLLGAHRPERVLVVTPPVVAPLLVWLWCVLHGRPFVVDCHTGAFHGRRWAWARPVHRWLLRRAQAVLVQTEEASALVETWGMTPLLAPR